MNNLESIYNRIFKIAFLIILGLYITINMMENIKNITYKPFILTIIILVVFVLLMFKISKNIHSESMAIALLLTISILVLVGWNIIYKPIPVSDYEVIWNAAHQINNGDFYKRILDKSDYFTFYNFQIPYTYYVAALLRIYDSILTIKIAEIITLLLTNVVLYKILRLSCQQGESFFGAVLFAVFPFIFIGSGIINNQHIGMLLGAIAVYIIIKNKTYSRIFISSIILSLGNLFRPTIIVIFLSIAFVLLIESITDRKKLFGLLIFISAFILFNEIANYLFINFHLAPYGIKSNDMYFKFLLGLTGTGLTQIPTTDAEHTYLFYDLQYYNFDYESYKEASRKFLLEKISTNQLDYGYIINKMKKFISAIDNQYMYGDIFFNNNHKLLMECLNFFGTLIYVTTIVSAFLQTIKQKMFVKNDSFFISAIAFCAYFGIYIFIEVQTRYRYEQYFFLFIMAVPIIYIMVNKLDYIIFEKLYRAKNSLNKNN